MIYRQRFAGILLMTLVGASCQGRETSAQYQQKTPSATLELGVNADGTASELWTTGVAIAIGQDSAEALARENIPFSPGALQWLEVAQNAVPVFAARMATLAEPFGIQPFDAIVAAGNRGSSDGFAWVDRFIGINVEAFAETYGAPNEHALDRMTRIIAHEYVHLLNYAVYPHHRELRDTPLNRALWTMFHEGIGDYTSVSSRWLPDEYGSYSPVTERTLQRLEPVVIERLRGLTDATAEEERVLRRGIAMGKFDEKWGSLPVALWLHSEAKICGAQNTLDKIVRLGPSAVLPLARRYVAPELRNDIDTLLTAVGLPDVDRLILPCWGATDR